MSPWLSELNEAQREAVVHDGGPLIVLAGPGTGKTRVITHRVAHLIHERGADPRGVLALTFTNKAAQEMRERIAALVSSASLAEQISAATFHSFGYSLIQRFGDVGGLRAEPVLIDRSRLRLLLRRIVDETGLGLDRRLYDPHSIVEDALGFIAEARNHAVFPEDALRYADQWRARLDQDRELTGEAREAAEFAWLEFHELARMYDLCDRACLERGWITFDDLQSQPIRILKTNRAIRSVVRTEFPHVVVDEFQDVNLAQIQLLKLLTREDHDLCVVGDDDQAIYGFRGSMQAAFRFFAEHWRNCRTVELSLNYRSGRLILDAADRIIRECDDRFRPDKRTRPAGGERAEPGVAEAVSYVGADGAGPVIARLIRQAVDAGTTRYGDCAILARTNNDLERIRVALELAGIPVATPDESARLRHPATMDVMSWLRILDDPDDAPNALRVLSRPPYGLPLHVLAEMGRRHQHARREAAEAGRPLDIAPFVDWIASGPLHEPWLERFVRTYSRLRQIALTEPADVVVSAVIHEAGLLTVDPIGSDAHRIRVERLGRFLGAVRTRTPQLDAPRRLRQFLECFDQLDDPWVELLVSPDVALARDGVEFSDRDAVRLLTAHKAKGLEFDTVFVPRVNKLHGYPQTRRSGEREEPYLPAELRRVEPVDRLNEERRVFFVTLTRAKRRLVLLQQSHNESRTTRTPGSPFWDAIVGPDAGLGVEAVDGEGLCEDAGAELDAGAIDVTPGQALRLRERLRIRHEVASVIHELSDPAIALERLQELQRRLIQAVIRLPLLAAEDPVQMERLLSGLSDADREAASSYIATLRAAEPHEQPIPNPRPPLELSYSDVSLYHRCPRCYWLRRVVGLPERPTPDVSFGSLVHKALELFYRRQMMAESASDGRAPNLADLLAIGRELLTNHRRTGAPTPARLEERLEKALRLFHQRFHDDTINPVQVELKVRFAYPRDGHTHFMTARIDRLDFDGAHRIVDYKTGRPLKRYLSPERTDLQLGIYRMAIEHYTGAECDEGTAEYWLTSVGERGVLPLAKLNMARIREKIDEAIDGILSGDWEPTEGCQECELIPRDDVPDEEMAEPTALAGPQDGELAIG